MRKSLAAFCLVFALLAGFFGYTVVEALDAQDAVSFTVEQQIGDPTAAQGMELNLSTSLDGDMVWDTTLPLSDPLRCRTDFRYDPGNINWHTEYSLPPTLEVPGTNMSLYIWADELSSSPAALAYQTVIQDVASRAPAGEGTHSETVNLKQYLDYYPVFLCNVPLPEPYDSSWEDWDLTQALHIPVGEADVVQIDVEKTQDGTIRSVSIFAPQGPSFINESVLCNGRYYIRFTPTDTEGALIPGASPAGLYSVPASAGSELAAENVTLCYQSQGLPSSLTAVDGGTHLLLVEELEQGQGKAVLLDSLTYQTVQEIPMQLPDTSYYLLVRDHYLALITTAAQDYPAPLNRATVWARNQFGLFEQVIDCDLTPTQFDITESPVTYYDQNRLVLASYQNTSATEYIQTPSVYVVVCTPEGIDYAAHLVHSQSTARIPPYTDLTLTPVS